MLLHDFDEANRILPMIGERELEKLSLFLQGQGFLEEAIKVTKDTMRKLDLAINMKNVELAIQLLGDKEIGKYWSQVADICILKGDMKTGLVGVGQDCDA